MNWPYLSTGNRSVAAAIILLLLVARLISWGMLAVRAIGGNAGSSERSTQTPTQLAAVAPTLPAQKSPSPSPTGVSPSQNPTAVAATATDIEDFSFVDAEHGWLLESSCLGDVRPCSAIIRASTDGGRTWPVSHPAPSSDLRVLRFFTAQDGWLYGLYGDDAWFGSYDGGATWSPGPAGGPVSSVQQVGGDLWAIQQQCPSHYAYDCPVRLLISSDLGRTWAPAPIQPPIHGVAGLQSTSAHDVWISADLDPGVSDKTLLLASHDSGRSWQARSNPCTLPFSNLMVTREQLWMMCAGYPGVGQVDEAKQLYHSTDDGQQWQVVAHHDFEAPQLQTDPAPGALPQPAFWGMAVSAPDQLWLIVAPGHLNRSMDGGQTWHWVDLPYENITPNDFGLGPIEFLDAQTGWVAGHSGLFRTTDGGEHWETIQIR